MLTSWLGSVSSRRSQSRQTRSSTPPVLDGPSDTSSLSRSTVGPFKQTSANLIPAPLDGDHAHIGHDPGVYSPTPSLIHSTEKEVRTLRTSDVVTSLDTTMHQRDSAQITKQAAAPDHPEQTLFTPQDAIIAQVFGQSVPPTSHASSPPPPSVSLMTSDSLQPPPSTQTVPSSSTRPGPTLTIYDPFSGTKLGEHTPISSSTATPGDLSSSTPIPTTDDRKLWSSLERILELQAEIAAMHVDMESVGGKGLGNTHIGGTTGMGTGEGGSAAPRKRSRRGQTLPIGDEEPEERESEGGATGAVSDISTDNSDGEDNDDDDDDDDIHGYGKKRRDEEFSRLAEQFAQRKVTIGGIMNKLDDLSTALKTFHALSPPLFDLQMSPSRTDTVSAPSNVSAFSFPSPLSPTSPPQAFNLSGPPTVTPPLPIPPVSTLVPPMKSEDQSAPPRRRSIVAPVLSRTALPRIIPGTPHVESPADMNPPQSNF